MKYCRGVLALIALVFAILDLSYSKWVIIAAAGLILIRSLMEIFKFGCGASEKCPVTSKEVESVDADHAHRTFSEFIMEKAKDGAKPSKKEVTEVLSKIVSKPAVSELTIEPVSSKVKSVKKKVAKKKAVKKKAPAKKKVMKKKSK